MLTVSTFLKSDSSVFMRKVGYFDCACLSIFFSAKLVHFGLTSGKFNQIFIS